MARAIVGEVEGVDSANHYWNLVEPRETARLVLEPGSRLAEVFQKLEVATTKVTTRGNPTGHQVGFSVTHFELFVLP